MRNPFLKLYIPILSVTLFSFILFLSEAHATVPTWDVSQNGPIPIIIPAINVSNFTQYIGHQYDKEFSIGNISLGTVVQGLRQAVAAAIPSWDGLAWGIAKFAIAVIKQQTIDWIKSGFEGKPLFLQDPEKFFTEVGEQATGVFIEDLGQQLAGDPQFFCKDFLPQIQLDIAGFGRRGYFQRARCTITQVVSNIEDYYDDFDNGRWDAFFKIQQRNNNQYGFYLMTLEEQQRRRDEAESNFQLAAQYGGGYLPKVDCIQSNAAGCRKIRIKTPSKAIADRITQTVGLDFGELTSADEISEVITALFDVAIQKTLESFLD